MTEKKAPDTNDEHLIWGIHSVWETIQNKPKTISDILVLKGKSGPRIQQIIDEARKHGVRLRFVESAHLGVAKKMHHQGVVARLASIPLLSVDEILTATDATNDSKHARILVLDSIQDPRNLGSILRSALGAGFQHVIMSRERSAPLSGTVTKTSAGAISHLQISRVGNIAQTLDRVKKKGFWTYGAVAPSDTSVVTSIYETDFSGQICLIIGSEDKGIRPLVQQHCDFLVTIPMEGGFDSLNASVAAAVIMFEIQRQSTL